MKNILFRLIKEVLPPVILKTLKFCFNFHNNKVWSGNYASWIEAKSKCVGYDDQIVLEKCSESLNKIKNGLAIYERDSVIFDKIQYSWGLLSSLQKVALEYSSKLCVLDFGGSLGSSYYQNKNFLNLGEELSWCIVEQKHFVDRGKELFESDKLKFFYNLDDCILHNKPNVILLSSVLQYLEEPYTWLDRILKLGIPYIIIDRTAFLEFDTDLLTIQNVPEVIYKASYPSWFFSKEKFLRVLKNYEIILEFKSDFEINTVVNNNIAVYWQGFLLKRMQLQENVENMT
jgi:putative methyltransferase (TIGR04325 family)